MKCPHCGYSDYKEVEPGKTVCGEDGTFYMLYPAQMERGCGGGTESKDLYGCPSCNRIFMTRF